jgi:hypothetical protein
MTHLIIWLVFVLVIIILTLWHARKALWNGKRVLAMVYGLYAMCFAMGAGAYVWFVY